MYIYIYIYLCIYNTISLSLSHTLNLTLPLTLSSFPAIASCNLCKIYSFETCSILNSTINYQQFQNKIWKCKALLKGSMFVPTKN